MWYEEYERKPVIKVKGGIKAQTKRGNFGQKWWAKQWISALESFHDSKRLGRGRRYARMGQVISIEISKGKVVADVQGTRTVPYHVEIQVDTLSQEAWRQVAEILSSKAIYVAKLLAGEMPSDIDEIFSQSNHHLLPNSHTQLKTDCTCPDWSNPCKHVAAVYYLIGEEFDRDPFLIFKLRGIDRKELIDLLERYEELPLIEEEDTHQNTQVNPLTSENKPFWQGNSDNDQFYIGEYSIPSKTGVLLKTLGKFPFWRGEENLQDILDEIYSKTSEAASHLLLEE